MREHAYRPVGLNSYPYVPLLSLREYITVPIHNLDVKARYWLAHRSRSCLQAPEHSSEQNLQEIKTETFRTHHYEGWVGVRILPTAVLEVQADLWMSNPFPTFIRFLSTSETEIFSMSHSQSASRNSVLNTEHITLHEKKTFMSFSQRNAEIYYK